jgi:phosphate-selective porin OprO/OprP
MQTRNASARPSRPLGISVVLAGAALIGALGGPAHAQQSSAIIDDLLEKLKDKGVLSQEEFDALKQAREQERTEQRAERRKQALKTAQEEEKKEKAVEASKTEIKGKFSNGFTWESGDKKNAVSIGGRIHADYRSFDPSGAGAAGTESADTFDIRRAYLTVSGKVWEHFTFDVTGDFANQVNSSHLDVAWINWGYWKEAQVRAGQFKMPFSLEELTSSRFIDFQERSLMNALVPAKERGAMIHGQPFTGVTYGLAYSNGQGKNTNDTNSLADGKDFIGRVTLNAAEWMGKEKDLVLHLGGAYSRGNIPAAAVPSARTEGRGITFFVPTAFTAADNQIERTRNGFETSLAWGPVKLQGEWTRANYQGRSTSAGNPGYDKDITSYYVEAMWLLTGEKYAAAYRNGVYGRIVPKTNFDPGAGTWGGFELGLRYSSWDATDFAVPSCAGGTAVTPANNGTGFTTVSCAGGALTNAGTNKADSYTVGLKWIMNPNMKMYLNYVQTNYDTPLVYRAGGTGKVETTDSEKAITLRFALDF